MSSATTPWVESTRAAFQAEYDGDFNRALELHGAALAALEKVIHDGRMTTTEPVRVAKLQRDVHLARRQYIQAGLRVKDSQLVPIPSSQGWLADINSEFTEFSLSKIELLTTGERRAALEASSPEFYQSFINNKLPPFTPSLNANLPVTKWYIKKSSENSIRSGGSWHYFTIQDKKDGKALYKLGGLCRRGIQTLQGHLYRASDLSTAIAVTNIDPAAGSWGSAPDAWKVRLEGRPVHISSAVSTVTEIPDRSGTRGWLPRRFSYGGRRFVWKQITERGQVQEELWEVEKEWPKPGSKTGKMEDITLSRRLAWTGADGFISLGMWFSFVGGLDQPFLEHLIASILAVNLVMVQSSK